MSFLDILYTLLITPLQTVFEIVYSFAYNFTGNLGISIIVLSLVINILVLPLYKRADAMQEEEKNIEAKLDKGVKHIKKTFKGDEQMMMLQTYYRQNNYKPTYVFKGATSLLLQIPFFIAAYNFLSNLYLLDGASFGRISDLGTPDGLLVIGGISVNVLPVLMTLVNFVSSFIYTKGYPLKTKIQLYGMALFFLVFLYNSPSGLVFYWTLNNVFSLVKTIFYKLKNPKKIIVWLLAIIGVALIGFSFSLTLFARLCVCVFGIVLLMPLALSKSKKKISFELKNKANPKLFFAGAVFMTLLTGGLIPSSVIASSPQEFVVIGYKLVANWYIVSSLCVAFGTFAIWLGIFYWLSGDKYRPYFDYAIWIVCGVALIDYMLFGTDFGTLSSSLQFEKDVVFTTCQELLNIGVIFVGIILFVVIYRFFAKQTRDILIIMSLAMCVMLTINVVKINDSISKVNDDTQIDENEALFTLSKSGKNVVVIMLDSAMSEYIPYIMNEKPELKEQFSGFTYYSNTVSFSVRTNLASPALYGGYEYTPIEENKRDTESLESKQNEALKVMPVLFDENGYNVTVCDPTYAGYQWIPDLSIYDDYPDIKAYNTKGNYTSEYMIENGKDDSITRNLKIFFRYSLTMVSPSFLKATLYDGGSYNSFESDSYLYQETDGYLKATGLSAEFYNSFNVLYNLNSLTSISDDGSDNFLMMSNDTTHEPNILQMTDYVPTNTVDNSKYTEQLENDYVIDGTKLNMNSVKGVSYYDVNMSAMIQLGKWFDYLKENGVYDNTRIILVADHGRDTLQFDDMISTDSDGTEMDYECFCPLLMVKDFNATEFTTSDEFMTNADVPTLATEDIIENPINPFTGKEINNDEKYAHDQHVIYSEISSVDENNGNTFLPGRWYSVSDNIWDLNNWTLLDTDAVLSDYNK